MHQEARRNKENTFISRNELSPKDVFLFDSSDSFYVAPQPLHKYLIGQPVTTTVGLKESNVPSRATPSTYRLEIGLKRSTPELPEPAETDCDFEILPPHVIQTIFSFLPPKVLCKCAQVSRRWRMHATHHKHWYRLNLQSKRVPLHVLHDLISGGLAILRLARTEIVIEADHDNLTFALPLCNLRYLDLSMANVPGPEVVSSILRRCENLVALSLENLAVDDQVMDAISRNRSMKILNLVMCEGITESGCMSLVGCRKLEELNMGWTHLDHDSVRIICSNLPPTLKRLSIAGCRNSSLFDDDILALIEECPAIIEIDVSDCTDLTGRVCEYFQENMLNLSVVHLSRCYQIPPRSYGLMLSMREINLFGTLTDKGIEVVQGYLRGPSPVRPRHYPNHMPVPLNQQYICDIARPTVGDRRSSIWLQRTRDA